VRNFLAIAALHEASMLAVSLLLAVVNGPRCKLARSYGVLSLIYVPTEANIPILEARSRFKIIVKVVPVGGMPSIRTSYFGRFGPCRRICASCFPFSKNCTVGRFQLQRHLPPAPAMPPASGGINQVDKQMVPVDFNSSFRV
jgi:hypothetical protein